jgi:pimeloyl-ACP methyl ester carboxylesterase
MLGAMTVVLVHGNPESDAIWRPLIAELGRDDVVCLSPPGFGAPVPAGFGAQVLDYRDWLVGQLVELGEPVHLVGHDWGGGHVVNVAMHRPDLLLSWATDVIGLYDPEYVWHDLAQIWQTPGAGEELVETMFGGTAAERAERMVGLGIPADTAKELAEAQGPEMGRSVLSLYRSATRPVLDELAKDLPAAKARPGLQISATEDHFVGSPELRTRAAAAAGAQVVELPGLGHWWMLQNPALGAQTLRTFFAAH